MAVSYSCDYCGEELDQEERIRLEGGRYAFDVKSREFSYHAECYGEVIDLLNDLADWAAHGEGSGMVWRLAEQSRPKGDPGAEVGRDDSDTKLDIEAERDRIIREENPWLGRSVPPTPEDHHLLADCDLGRYAVTALREHRIRSLEEASELTRLEVLGLRGISVKGADQLEVALAAVGLNLRPGPTPQGFGERMAERRERLGMSRRDLADLVDPRVLQERPGEFKWRVYGVHAGDVSAWERGAKVPCAGLVARLAEALEVPREELLEVA